MKPRTIEDKMLFAATLIEREGYYNFDSQGAPESCYGVGCVLGWIAYTVGVEENVDAAEALGYTSSNAPSIGNTGLFYEDMHRACGSMDWIDDCHLAADALRTLAQERMAARTTGGER